MEWASRKLRRRPTDRSIGIVEQRLKIQAGKKYVLEYIGEQLVVTAMRQSAVAGWWFCVVDGRQGEDIFPAKAFIAEAT